MIGSVVINNIDSSDYGVYISEAGLYEAASRDTDNYKIPGRSGDLVVDKGTYSNIEITYQAFIHSEFGDRFPEWRNAISSIPGYARIEDSFHPDEFRKGKLSRFRILRATQDTIGTFYMEFDCMPQRFLKSGEEPVEFTEDGTIENEYRESLPLIRVYGSGELGIGNQLIEIQENDFEYIDIDCEIMDCYSGATNCNQYVSQMGQYPKLRTGITGITLGSGITSVEITPRWWIL